MMQLVLAWSALVVIVGLPLWLFGDGLLRGYLGEEDWKRRGIRASWSKALAVLAISTIVVGSAVSVRKEQREQQLAEEADPCRHRLGEMQRKHPQLAEMSSRHVDEIMALQKQDRRAELLRELAALDEPELDPSNNRFVQRVLAEAKKEQEMYRAQAAAWSEMSIRHKREWEAACLRLEGASPP